MTAAEGVTMTGKTVLAVLVPSLTVTVIGATPVWPEAGVMVMVRLVPLPPKEIFAGLFGTRVELAQLPDTVRLVAGVSASPMVKASVGAGMFTSVFVRGIGEMNGAVLLGRTVTAKLVLFDFPPGSAT